jgi:hypothetical protein
MALIDCISAISWATGGSVAAAGAAGASPGAWPEVSRGETPTGASPWRGVAPVSAGVNVCRSVRGGNGRSGGRGGTDVAEAGECQGRNGVCACALADNVTV